MSWDSFFESRYQKECSICYGSGRRMEDVTINKGDYGERTERKEVECTRCCGRGYI